MGNIGLMILGIVIAALVMRNLSRKFKPLILFYIISGIISGIILFLTGSKPVTFIFHLWATMVPFFIMMLLMGLLSS
jgi:hypothetical protein